MIWFNRKKMIESRSLQQFLNGYKLLKQLKYKSHIIVYSATDLSTGKTVVIKMFTIEKETTNDYYGFMYEALIYQRLQELQRETPLPNIALMAGIFHIHSINEGPTGYPPSKLAKALLANKEYYARELEIPDTDSLQTIFLVTHMVPGNMTLYEYFLSPLFKYKSEQAREQIVRHIVFQLIYTLTIFEKNGLQHNDLHLSNIMVDIDETRDNYLYMINDKVYDINHTVKPVIIDWNLGTCAEAVADAEAGAEASLGINRGLEHMANSGVFSDINSRYDIYLFLRSLFLDIADTVPAFTDFYHSVVQVRFKEPLPGRLCNWSQEEEPIPFPPGEPAYQWTPTQTLEHTYFDSLLTF